MRLSVVYLTTRIRPGVIVTCWFGPSHGVCVLCCGFCGEGSEARSVLVKLEVERLVGGSAEGGRPRRVGGGARARQHDRHRLDGADDLRVARCQAFFRASCCVACGGDRQRFNSDARNSDSCQMSRMIAKMCRSHRFPSK